MDELLMQYADKFHENFPIFIVGDMDESELKRKKTAFIKPTPHFHTD